MLEVQQGGSKQCSFNVPALFAAYFKSSLSPSVKTGKINLKNDYVVFMIYKQENIFTRGIK